jgi:hypothetical protein
LRGTTTGRKKFTVWIGSNMVRCYAKKLLCLFFLMLNIAALAQDQKQDSLKLYVDRHGVKISFTNMDNWPEPITLTFLQKNFHSGFIFGKIDTTNIHYRLNIAAIGTLQNKLEFRMKLFQSSNPHNSIINPPGYAIYKLTLRKNGHEYVIQKVDYLYSEI